MVDDGYSYSTTEKIRNILKPAFEVAVINKLIPENPYIQIKLPEKIQEDIQAFKRIEQAKFINSVNYQFNLGKTSRGGFACIPDWGAGCHLVNLKDYFWNTEQLVLKLGKVDGITVSTALYNLSSKIHF